MNCHQRESFPAPPPPPWPVMAFAAETDIRKYYSENYFLTFKCYCFHPSVGVAAPMFIWRVDKCDRKTKPHRVFDSYSLGYPTTSRRPGAPVLGRTTDVSIIECLMKKKKMSEH